ncbi:MAG TPA: hypothetical protein VKN18_32030 [Blastocatellia bacterium]|nr:hypothetical protein [Blastocatellia bacterium]
MHTKLVIRTAALGVLFLLLAGFGKAQDVPKKYQQKPATTPPEPVDQKKLIRPPSGPGFYIAPVEGSKGMFSILLGDGSGNTVAGSFTLQQVEIFEAVLEAAKVFAFSEEKVGSSSPITTRLMEQHEWSLFVDVTKIGKQSKVYISLITPQGRLTAPAGEITRDSKKEPSALFLEVLGKVQEAKNAAKPLQ